MGIEVLLQWYQQPQRDPPSPERLCNAYAALNVPLGRRRERNQDTSLDDTVNFPEFGRSHPSSTHWGCIAAP